MRVLLVWFGSLPADPGRTVGYAGGQFPLCVLRGAITDDVGQSSHDWLQQPRTNLLAWWIPQAAIVAGLFAPVAAPAAIWIIALIWMGTACILNAKRCGRTHCRYTGPYYLTMIAPTLVLGLGFLSVGLPGWLILAFVILLGSKLLWWGTERAWGKFS